MHYLITDHGEVVSRKCAPNPETAIVMAGLKYRVNGERGNIRVYTLATMSSEEPQIIEGDDLEF